MVLDSLSQKERRTLTAAFTVVVLASLTVGYAGATTITNPTGSFSGNSASEDEIRSAVQEIMNQQIQQQQQQLALVAQRSENISEEDLSIDAEITDISQSEFSGLYRVTVSITGDAPSQQNPGETEAIDDEQVLFISQDGRYLFRQPTDLEAEPEQPEQPQQPQQQPPQ